MAKVIRRQLNCSCTMAGVWTALEHNEGAAVIFHSPKACGHIGRDMHLGMHFRCLARRQFPPQEQSAQLFVSNLTDKHAIFGGTDQLQQCIDGVVETYQPKYVVIANSCVAGVIGDDTQAVAGAAEQKWGIPIMAVDGHGFLDGDYYTGFYQAGRVLVERLMTPQASQPGTVTVVGERGRPIGMTVQEISSLLRPLGLKIHAHFPAYASLADIERVPASSLLLSLGGSPNSYQWVCKLAEDISKRFAIPLFDHDYPAGWQATQEWLHLLGSFVGRPQQAGQIRQEQAVRLRRQADNFSGVLADKRVVLCVGRPVEYFRAGWLLELFTMAGIALDHILVMDTLLPKYRQALVEEMRQLTDVPIMLQTNETEIRNVDADAVFTTHELPDAKVRQIVLPLMPPAGVGGLIDFMEKTMQLMYRYGQRGGIVYA